MSDSKRLAAVKETVAMRHRGVSPINAPHPLAGPIYTAPKKPKHCNECGRKGVHMDMLNAGVEECSRIPCPNRKTCTAQPSQQGPRHD